MMFTRRREGAKHSGFTRRRDGATMSSRRVSGGFNLERQPNSAADAARCGSVGQEFVASSRRRVNHLPSPLRAFAPSRDSK
jgi:hypothetical protein